MVKINRHNCLSVVNPKLAEEWDYEKNNNITPDRVAANSKKKYWWECKNRHRNQRFLRLFI